MAYEVIKRRGRIMEEAYDRGLEFRLGGFFYSPDTVNYESEFRRRWLKWGDVISNIRPGKNTLRKIILAGILHSLLHPIRVLKNGDRIVKGDLF